MIDILDSKIHKAGDLIKKSKYLVAFTGAGISVESGIPPFRGTGGIWEKYDPKVLDLSYFYKNPGQSWLTIREIFSTFFGKVQPNAAHTVLSDLEHRSILKTTITQNIDGLHQKAGCKKVLELHGTLNTLVCTKCKDISNSREITFKSLPLYCKKCEGLLKPDFVFFGEQLPEDVFTQAIEHAQSADVLLLIGSTGTVAPAANIPYLAKEHNCKIIEINTEPSAFTNTVSDIFLKGKAGEIMKSLLEKIIDDGRKEQN